MGFDANQMRESLPEYIQKKFLKTKIYRVNLFFGEGGNRIAGMGCIAIRTS